VHYNETPVMHWNLLTQTHGLSRRRDRSRHHEWDLLTIHPVADLALKSAGGW